MKLQYAVGMCVALYACGNDGTGPGNGNGGGTGGGPTISTLLSVPAPDRLIVRDSVVYWRDGSDTPLNKLSLRSAVRTPLLKYTPIPDGVIADGQYVFWISFNDLYRTSLDGTTTTLLDHGQGAGAAMVMDANYVYWVNTAPSGCSPPCRYAIRRVPKVGGAATTVVTTSDGIGGVPGFAVAGGYLYWEEEGIGPVSSDGSVGSKLNKVALAGGPVTTLVNGLANGLIAPPSPGFIPASWHPRGGMVVDDTLVYFADASFSTWYRVMSISVNGGAINVLLADTTGDGGNFVRSMVGDATTLYWVDKNSLRSMPKTGGGFTDLAGPLESPLSLTRVGSNLYWVQSACCAHGQKGSIQTVSIAGGTPVTLKSNLDAPTTIASDAAHFYWIEGGPIGGIEGFANLSQAALDGSNEVTLIEASGGGPFDVDANYVYFANSFTIKRVSVNGGAAERLAIGYFYVRDLATDGQYVYWVEDGGLSLVYKMAVNGGPIIPLGSGPGPAGRIRLDATHVYWLAHEDEIDRVPKAGGPTERVAGPIPGSVTDFAIDGTSIYLSEWDQATIVKTPLSGGAITPLTSLPADQTRRIATDGVKVYWIDQLDVGSITVDGRTLTPIHSGVLSGPFSSNTIALDNQSVYWTEVAGDAIKQAKPK